MSNVKTRFVVAITQKLSAAPDSDAKLELIEELSENLCGRYEDMTAAGVPEDEAYHWALEELGDVNELLTYLKGLGPDGALPRNDAGDLMSGLFRDIGGLAEEAVAQAQRAMDDAAAMVQDAADQFQQYRAERNAGWAAAGAEGMDSIPSDQVCAIDLELTSGDVSVSFDGDPNAPVRLTGDTEELQVRLNENGQLSIRQGRTASGTFFRAFRSTDVELVLPRRHWEAVRIVTASGDVDIEAGLVTDRLQVKTASGDLDLCHADCGELVFQSASGDFSGENLTGSVRAETMSGDISLSGMLMLREVRCSSVSGDVEVYTDLLPERLELSSKSGDCEAAVPDNGGFTLKFHTVSGDLFSDFPLSGATGGRSGEAAYLGGGPVLRLSTVSGDIALLRR